LLEAFNTSGGSSTLPHTFKKRLNNLDYKTMRYPGHCELVNGLFALGLSDENAVSIGEASVVPRKFLEEQLRKHLSKH